MLKNSAFLFVFSMLISNLASAAQIATFEGAITVRNGGSYVDVQIRGEFTNIPAKCKGYFSSTAFSGAATASPRIERSLRSCQRAIITLDLEGSSLCQNQGGMEVYYSPTVLSAQCF